MRCERSSGPRLTAGEKLIENGFLVPTEGFDEDVLDGQAVLVAGVELAVALRPAEMDPVSSAVAGAPDAGRRPSRAPVSDTFWTETMLSSAPAHATGFRVAWCASMSRGLDERRFQQPSEALSGAMRVLVRTRDRSGRLPHPCRSRLESGSGRSEHVGQCHGQAREPNRSLCPPLVGAGGLNPVQPSSGAVQSVGTQAQAIRQRPATSTAGRRPHRRDIPTPDDLTAHSWPLSPSRADAFVGAY